MSTGKTPLGAFAHWPRQPCDRALLREMNDAAISAVDRWEAAKGLPAEISEIVGADVELEYAVPGLRVTIPGGPGRSRCDVFVRVKTGRGIGGIGITATADDGFGEAIHKWRKNRKGGGKGRLSTVCSALEIRNPPPQEMCYQPFHRLVAAIYTADAHNADFAGMIVQSFSRRSKGFDDFEAFCKLLGTKLEPGKPCWSTLKSGRRILLAWVGS